MRARLSLLVLAGLLLSASGALADHNGQPRLDATLDPDGTGTLIANPGGHDISWRRCFPNGTCEPFADDQVVEVADEPVGVVFEATQSGVTLRSEPWQGRTVPAGPPGVTGPVQVGQRVVPVASPWAGGWGGAWAVGGDWLQLQACTTPAADRCLVVFDPRKFGRCHPAGGRTLPARYEGWWLRVVDRRLGPTAFFTDEAYGAPEGVAPLVPGPATSARVVGRIAHGRAPQDDCGDQSRGALVAAIGPSLLRTGRREADGSVRVGSVPCGGCFVELEARRGAVLVRRKVVGPPGAPVVLRLTKRQAAQLGSRRVRVRARIDQGTWFGEVVRLP